MERLDGMCADINNEPRSYEVNVIYHKKDIEYEVSMHTDLHHTIVYTIRQVYRNSKGDIMDDKLLKVLRVHRCLLGAMIDRLVRNVRNESIN